MLFQVVEGLVFRLRNKVVDINLGVNLLEKTVKDRKTDESSLPTSDTRYSVRHE